MQMSDQPEALPLACAARIVSELNVMRRECSQLAGRLMSQQMNAERGVADCVQLDSALERAHGLVRDAVNEIRSARPSRLPPPE
jgi:hypothetical protein